MPRVGIGGKGQGTGDEQGRQVCGIAEAVHDSSTAVRAQVYGYSIISAGSGVSSST